MIIKEFSEQRARKDYKCDVCDNDIKRGDVYSRYYEDSGGRWTLHLKCYVTQLKKEFKVNVPTKEEDEE